MDLVKHANEKNLHAILDLRYYTVAWTSEFTEFAVLIVTGVFDQVFNATAALLYFDWLLTLPSEIRCVWKSRISVASTLYVVNRYLAMAAYVPVIVGLFNPHWNSHFRCSTFSPFIASINTINQFIIGIILVLRTYALYQRRIMILVVVGIPGTVSVVLGAWAASQVKGWYLQDSRFGMCMPSLEDSGRGLKLSWIATFVFDFVVFALTVARTVRLITAHNLIHLRSSLASILLRDGSLFFFSLCAANILNFIWVTHDGGGSFLASCVTGTNSIFYHILSVVLLSRLILNLREENLRRSTPTVSINALNDHLGMDAWVDDINNLFSNIASVDQMVFQDRTSGLTFISVDGMLPVRDSQIFGAESELNDSSSSNEDHFETCDQGDKFSDEDEGGSDGVDVANSGIGSRRERSDSQRALIAPV